jgi:hypothetical protein
MMRWAVDFALLACASLLLSLWIDRPMGLGHVAIAVAGGVVYATAERFANRNAKPSSFDGR